MDLFTPNLTFAQATELVLGERIGETSFFRNPKNVNERSEMGESPLHVQNDPKVVKLLLDSGANPNAKTFMKNSPLHYPKCYECVKLLLDYGADPNATNSYENTPLHKQQHPLSVKYLLNAGAKKNILNIHKKLPRDVNPHVPKSRIGFWIGLIVLIILFVVWVSRSV